MTAVDPDVGDLEVLSDVGGDGSEGPPRSGRVERQRVGFEEMHSMRGRLDYHPGFLQDVSKCTTAILYCCACFLPPVPNPTTKMRGRDGRGLTIGDM